MRRDAIEALPVSIGILLALTLLSACQMPSADTADTADKHSFYSEIEKDADMQVDDGNAAGAETSAASSDESRTDNEPELAKLVSFKQTSTQVIFEVVSTGCTTEQSVEPVVERQEDGAVQLTLLRIKPDWCRRMPMARRIVYSLAELGIADESVVLVNPIGKLPGRRTR